MCIGENVPLPYRVEDHRPAGAMVPSIQRSERVRAWHRCGEQGGDRIMQSTHQWEGNIPSDYSALL